MGLTVRDPMTEYDASEGRLALEAKTGADSLDVLLDMRDQIIERLAPLRPRFGPANMYDDRRKQMLEACKVRARQKLNAEGVYAKITEGMVDAEAYTDPQYVALMDQGERDAIEYIKTEHELFKVDQMIEARAQVIRAWTAEARL